MDLYICSFRQLGGQVAAALRNSSALQKSALPVMLDPAQGELLLLRPWLAGRVQVPRLLAELGKAELDASYEFPTALPTPATRWNQDVSPL